MMVNGDDKVVFQVWRKDSYFNTMEAIVDHKIQDSNLKGFINNKHN
jgi:hypothetical protein